VSEETIKSVVNKHIPGALPWKKRKSFVPSSLPEFSAFRSEDYGSLMTYY
jgi:hypothetical protein